MPTRPKGGSLPPLNVTFDLYKSVGVPEESLVCASNSSAVIALGVKGHFCFMLGIENASLSTAQEALCSRSSGMARILKVLKLLKILPTFNKWCLLRTEMLKKHTKCKTKKQPHSNALGSPSMPYRQRLLCTDSKRIFLWRF